MSPRVAECRVCGSKRVKPGYRRCVNHPSNQGRRPEPRESIADVEAMFARIERRRPIR